MSAAKAAGKDLIVARAYQETGALVIEGTGEMFTPVPLDGEPYAWQASNMSAYKSLLTQLYICDGVEGITGWAAFKDCINLTNVEISDTVTKIDLATFNGCLNLTSIRIPIGVTEIGNNLFKNCTKLSEVILPKGITSIGNFTFNGCSELKTIKYNGTKSDWNNVSTVDDWDYNATIESIYCMQEPGNDANKTITL